MSKPNKVNVFAYDFEYSICVKPTPQVLHLKGFFLSFLHECFFIHFFSGKTATQRLELKGLIPSRTDSMLLFFAKLAPQMLQSKGCFPS